MLRGTFAKIMLLGGFLLSFTAGCLSLGGKTSTTHVHDNPETQGRIATLEARVAELEAALGKNAPTGPGTAFP